jgi:hypothetical protein
MFYFDVFSDPSVLNAETADLEEVETDSGATLTERTFYGTSIQIKKAWNLALLYGWPVSKVRTVAAYT